jgi:hypothetical protein
MGESSTNDALPSKTARPAMIPENRSGGFHQEIGAVSTHITGGLRPGDAERTIRLQNLPRRW